MTITLRIEPELQEALDQAARRAGITRSAFVRRCIREALEARKQQATPWELGKDLFGRHGSGRSCRPASQATKAAPSIRWRTAGKRPSSPMPETGG